MERSRDRIAILFNPIAGKGKAAKKRALLESLLRKHDVLYDLFVTRSADHLRALTRETCQKYDTLAGAGGDSTFQIMVEEIIKAGADPNFGLIGLGSSNDIAVEFRVETLEKACLALKEKKTRKTDVGCIHSGETVVGCFLGQANIGLGVWVNQYVENMARRRPRLGKRQTLVGALGILDAFRSKKIPIPLRIESEDAEIDGEFILAVFSNIRHWASGRLINPAGRTDDGRLDACLIRECSLFRLLRLASLAKKGGHGKAEEVSFFPSRSFEIFSERPFSVQADGEIIGGWSSPSLFKKIRLIISPQALKVIHV